MEKEEPKCTCKEHDPYCCQVHGTCSTCVKKEELKNVILGYKTSLIAQILDKIELEKKCTCENPTDNTCSYCEKENKIEILKEAKKRALEEELEEAANRLFPISKGGSMWMPSTHDCNQANKQEGFIEGAKYMVERMYSEEDMIKFAEFVATYTDKNRNVQGQMLHAKSKYDGSERTIDLFGIWLKQFKKK
jgi:hypothetical protein